MLKVSVKFCNFPANCSKKQFQEYKTNVTFIRAKEHLTFKQKMYLNPCCGEM